jgi:hypothetical protein
LQGTSRVLIHEEHADLLGPSLVRDARGSELEDAVGQGLPSSLRRVWPWLAREPLFTCAVAVLSVLFRVGVALRWLGLETLAARGIGSLETQRGVLTRDGGRTNPGPASVP